MRFISTLAVLVLILQTACNSAPKLDITEFDANRWKQDKYGCSGARLPMAQALAQERDKLIGLTEQELLQLLGRADEQELYKRNQKFLRYYVSANSKCNSAEPMPATKKPPLLQVRLNAIGIVNEVHLQD